MKKLSSKVPRIMVLLTAAIIFLSSCTTLADQSNLRTDYEDGNVSASVIVANRFVDLTVENKTNSVVTLSVDGSTTIMKNGETSKLIPKGTRYIEVNAVQSPLSIAPLGTLKKSFAPAHAINWDDNWKINSWVDKDNFSLVFPYFIDGIQKHIVIQTSLLEKENIVGNVEVSKNYWHIFWLNSDKYQNELYDLAMNEATKLYGNDIKLVNGTYHGAWSPLSLVLYFNLFGYVDKITFTAEVQKAE